MQVSKSSNYYSSSVSHSLGLDWPDLKVGVCSEHSELLGSKHSCFQGPCQRRCKDQRVCALTSQLLKLRCQPLPA